MATDPHLQPFAASNSPVSVLHNVFFSPRNQFYFQFPLGVHYITVAFIQGRKIGSSHVMIHFTTVTTCDCNCGAQFGPNSRNSWMSIYPPALIQHIPERKVACFLGSWFCFRRQKGLSWLSGTKRDFSVSSSINLLLRRKFIRNW